MQAYVAITSPDSYAYPFGIYDDETPVGFLMIGYNEAGFRLRVIGTNSGARIIFRCIEGPQNEVWGFDFVDDFTGSRTFDLTISDFRLMLNKYDSKFDPDCISYIELVIEAAKEASITVTEARFVNIERTKPRSFDINSASVEDDVVVTLNKSAFANNYRVLISSDKDFNNIIFDKTQEDLVFKFDKSRFDVSTPYYIKAISTNELGETIASNSGFVFYLNDVNSMIMPPDCDKISKKQGFFGFSRISGKAVHVPGFRNHRQHTAASRERFFRYDLRIPYDDYFLNLPRPYAYGTPVVRETSGILAELQAYRRPYNEGDGQGSNGDSGYRMVYQNSEKRSSCNNQTASAATT